jgi:arylsulfatase A-like enzyme
VKKYQLKLEKSSSAKDRPYILEGKPGIENPLLRTELDSLIDEEQYSGFQIFSNQTVKIKQHQDNTQFAAMVESMDESMGRILSKLEELNIDDHTLVIFYSDNGGMSAANFWDPNRIIPKEELDKAFSTSNLPLRGGKGWLYEGGIRVPLIIKWPDNGLQATVCDVPVTSPDFYPTILEILGIQDRAMNTDGVSIVPLLKGKKEIDRNAIYWHFPHYSNHGMQSPGGAVRSGDYKLLEYYETDKVQLFNLKDDMNEQYDLSALEPKKVTELRNMLHNWRENIEAKMMEMNPDYDDY